MPSAGVSVSMPLSGGGGNRGGVGISSHAEEGGSQRCMRLRRHTTSMELGRERNLPITSVQPPPDVDANSHPVCNKRPRKRRRQELLITYMTAVLDVVSKERDQVEAELRALVYGTADEVKQEKQPINSSVMTTPENEKQGRSTGRSRDKKLVYGDNSTSPRSFTSPWASLSSSPGLSSPSRSQPYPPHDDGGTPPSLATSLAANVAIKKELVPAKETDESYVANHALVSSSEVLRMKEEVSMIKKVMAVMDEPAGVVMADVRGLPPDMDDDAVQRCVLRQLAPTEPPGLLAVSAARDYIKTLDTKNKVGKKRHINSDGEIETKGMSRFQQAQAFEDLLNQREVLQNRLKVFTKARTRPCPPWKLARRRPVHWSYLLLEMAAMATDFYEERKWKLNAACKAAQASGIRANASKMGSLLWATDAMVANAAIAVAAHMCRYFHPDGYCTPSKVYNNHNTEGPRTSARRMEALETVLHRAEEVVARTNREGEDGNSNEKGGNATPLGEVNTLSSAPHDADPKPVGISPVVTNNNGDGGGAEIKEAKVELKQGYRFRHACPAPLRQELQLLLFQKDAIRLVQQLHNIGVGALVKGGVGQGKTVAVCGIILDVVRRDLAHAIQSATSPNTNEAPGTAVNSFALTSPNDARVGVTQTQTALSNENNAHITAAIQQSSPTHPVEPGTPKQEMPRLPSPPLLILCPAMSLLRWFAELRNCDPSLRIKLWEDWCSEEETEAKGLHHYSPEYNNESETSSPPYLFSNLSGVHVVLCSHEAAEIPSNRAELSRISWLLAVLDLRISAIDATRLNPLSIPSMLPIALEVCTSAKRRISILHTNKEEEFFGHDDLAALACIVYPSAFSVPSEAPKWSAQQEKKNESTELQPMQARNESSLNLEPSGFKLSEIFSHVTVVMESGVTRREKSVEKAAADEGQSKKDVEGNHLEKTHQATAVVNCMFVTCPPSEAQKQAYNKLKNDLSVLMALSWKPNLFSPVSGKGIANVSNSNNNEEGGVSAAAEVGAMKAARALDVLCRTCQWSEDACILKASSGTTTNPLPPKSTGTEQRRVDPNHSPPSCDGEGGGPLLQSSTTISQQIGDESELPSHQPAALEVMEAVSGKLKPLSEVLCQLMETGKRVLVLTEAPSCMMLVRRYLLNCGIAHDCCGDEDDAGSRAKEVWMGRGQKEEEKKKDGDDSHPIDCTSVPFVDLDGERGAWLRTQCALWRTYRCHPGWRALLMSQRAMARLGAGGGLKFPRFEAVLVIDGDIADAHKLLVTNGLSLGQRGQPCDLIKFFTSGTLEEAEARAQEAGKSMSRSLLGRPVAEVLNGIFSREWPPHSAEVAAATTAAREGKNEMLTSTAKCGRGGDEVAAVAHGSNGNAQLFLGGSIEAASAVERILSGLKEASSWIQHEGMYLSEEQVRSSPLTVPPQVVDDEAGGSLALTLASRKCMVPSIVPGYSNGKTELPMSELFYRSDSLGPLGPVAQFVQCYASLQLQGVPCAPFLYAGLPRLRDIIQDNSPFIPQHPKQIPMVFMPLGNPTLDYLVTLVYRCRERTQKLKQPREKRRMTTSNAPPNGTHISHPKPGVEMAEMWAAVEDALLIALKEQFMGCWSIVRYALETRAAALGLRGRMRSTSACREHLLYLQSLPPGHNVLETGSVHPPLLLHPSVLHCVGTMLTIDPLPPSATQGSPAIFGSSENPVLPVVDVRSTCGRRFTAVKDAMRNQNMKPQLSLGGRCDPITTVAKPHPSHAKAVAEAGASQATVCAPTQVIDSRVKAVQQQQ